MNSAADILKNMKPITGNAGEEKVIPEIPENLKFRNLFITGAPGVGKTYHAKEILQSNIDDYNARVESFSSVKGADVFKLKNCSELMFLARRPKMGEDLYYECIKLRGLVLDDLGIGKRSDFIPDIIYLIIDKRIEMNRPTIVTSNLSLTDISEIIDDRLASRLSGFEYLKIEGEDKRVSN